MTIPAGDPGWRVRRAKHTWKSPRRTEPKLKLYGEVVTDLTDDPGAAHEAAEQALGALLDGAVTDLGLPT